MLNGLRGAPLVVMVALNLTAGTGAAGTSAAPQTEANQVVGAELKKLYMAAAAAAPQSVGQQKIILQMAEKAANGKELLLVMRASVGAFPPNAPLESQVNAIVTTKMMDAGTLDQMIEYATQYPVKDDRARAYVQRMFQLAEKSSEPRVWYRIRVAASHLKVGDLEKQAQARGDRLAGK